MIAEKENNALTSRGQNFIAGITIALLFALVVARVILGAFVVSVWDDAYIHVRYADNLIASGRLVWNLGGDPAFGLTSMLYVLVVAAARMAGLGLAASAAASSIALGISFLLLLGWILLRDDTVSLSVRLGYVIMVLAMILWNLSRGLGVHFISGMDTAFALCYVTLYLWAAGRHERNDTAGSALLLGGLGGMAFWVRPDLMVFSYAVPAAFIVFGPAGRRRRAALALALTVGLTAVQLALSARYFDSALPLPFYCKSLSQYGKNMQDLYRMVPRVQLYYFVRFNFPVFAAVAAGLVAAAPGRGRAIGILDRGLLAACAAFIGYYLLLVTQIMFWDQRFYYPTFPALTYLGLHGAGAAENWARRKYPALPQLAARAWLALPAVAMLAAVLLALTTTKIVKKNWDEALDLDRFYHPNLFNSWYFLDEFRRLPKDLAIASTEVGVLGAMTSGHVVIDLAGLNDTTLARRGFSAAYVLDQRRPDLIFMPVFHYREMIDAIKNHPTFQRDYEFFGMPTPDKKPRMDIAIRRDSPYYPAMREIITRNLPAARQWCQTRHSWPGPHLGWSEILK